MENNIRVVLDNAARSIKTTLPGCTVLLFGSRARGDHREDSDVDLCVLVPEYTHSRLEMIVDARCAFKQCVRMPLDLLLYTHDEFEESAKKPSRKQYHIKREGVALGG
jgi:predicted nucleotidyltransferase